MGEIKPSVLIVEDDRQFIQILEFFFNKVKFKYNIANNGEEALQILKSWTPDIIVSDIMMPSMDGFAFRHQLLKDPDLRLIPFVFLSAKGTIPDKVAGLKLSVDDYITKPFEPEELMARIDSILQKHRMFGDLIRYDSLTNLYNRRTLESKLKQELNRARRYQLNLSVFMVDIDSFKSCNDTYGHDFGDYVIILLAERILNDFRDVDYSGRMGGDEFVIVMPETDGQSALLVAERFRQNIQGMKIHRKPFELTISGGLATVPDDADTMVDLLKRADLALYEAKRSGRNRIAQYSKKLEDNDP